MGYSVKQAESPDELANLEVLWNRNFGEPAVPRHQTYARNPSGQGRVWALKTDAGQVAGGIGWVERQFRMDGETVPAGQSINLAVDGEHRSAGPAVMLVRALTCSIQKSNALFVLGATNSAQAVVKRAGFRPLCDVERWTKPIHTEYKLKQILKNPIAARLAAFGADWGLRLISPETWRGRPAGLFADPGTGVWHIPEPEKVDEFARIAAPAPIFGERTAAGLEWRFRYATAHRHQLFWLRGEDRSSRGYVVYHFADDIVEVDDFFFTSPADFDWLLCEFLRHVRRHPGRANAVSVTCGGAPYVTRLLRMFGFSRREEPKQCLVCPSPGLDAATQQRLLDPSQWFLTNFDLDL